MHTVIPTEVGIQQGQRNAEQNICPVFKSMSERKEDGDRKWIPARAGMTKCLHGDDDMRAQG